MKVHYFHYDLRSDCGRADALLEAVNGADYLAALEHTGVSLAKTVKLHRLHVQRRHRGRGLGRKLLLDVLDWADARGLHVILKIKPFDGRASRRQVEALRGLYGAVGFRTIHTDGEPTDFMLY